MAQIAMIGGMALAQIIGTWGSDKISGDEKQKLIDAVNEQIKQDNAVIDKQKQFDQDTINMLQGKYDENLKYQKQQQDIQMNAVLTQLQLDQLKVKQAEKEAQDAKNLLPGVASLDGLSKNNMILIGAGVLAVILLIR